MNDFIYNYPYIGLLNEANHFGESKYKGSYSRTFTILFVWKEIVVGFVLN
jgi:hypothetical protein